MDRLCCIGTLTNALTEHLYVSRLKTQEPTMTDQEIYQYVKNAVLYNNACMRLLRQNMAAHCWHDVN